MYALDEPLVASQSLLLERVAVRRYLAMVPRVLLFGVAALFIVAPLAWLIVLSFATGFRFPSIAPSALTLGWWRVVIDSPGLLHAVLLSVWISPIVLVVSSVICLPAAYALGRSEFFGKRAVLLSIFSVSAFPRITLYVSMIPLLFLFNLMGTVIGVVAVQLIGTILFMTWIPATGFAAIPSQLIEAARDAGASPLRVFWHIVLPLARPSIAVAAVLSFLASFDEAQGTFLVGAPRYITMPVEMYNLVLNYPAGVSAVFAILLSIPSALLLLSVRNVLFAGTASALHLR